MLLIVYGILVRNEVVRAHREDASADTVTALTGAAGLAFIGGGLEAFLGSPEWRVFMLPAIVGGGVMSLRLAWMGTRHPFVRELRGTAGGASERRGIRSGLWMLGLSWPMFALWAIGLITLDP